MDNEGHMEFEQKLREECAVFGCSLKTDEAVGITYNSLLSLQHRGQEGAGIAVVGENLFVCHKDVGLVSEVFSKRVLEKIPPSRIALGHVRYSTTGGNVRENCGPFITEYLTGRIATAHNGNITNAQELRYQLKTQGLNFNSSSDSEVISSLIAFYAMNCKSVLQGIVMAANDLRGAFSIVLADSENRLIAIRDPNGYRPLCIGKSGLGFAVASESCALEACGFEFIRDVLPGEVIAFEKGALVSEGVKLAEPAIRGGLCIFEYVYFSRPDSTVDGLSVYEARHNMGRILAEEFPVEADIVCGVPDSGLEAAQGYSEYSGIPVMSGFVKNRYIGRSFIYPTQSERDSAVRLKLNPLTANVKGKRIVLVDDSIVRGTTSERIVSSLKLAGAKQVHMRISSPPFRHTCHFGTDIDNEDKLIANNMSIDEIRQKIGADSLGYISIDGLRKACNKCSLSFCTACFTGHVDGVATSKHIFELEGNQCQQKHI
ncbi:MAG: amidophosphoribosyltransferase [Oscillospiraceae bacterium]|nr:amidophosphoribosyltransferase [Oscillospiraceae bacterium]